MGRFYRAEHLFAPRHLAEHKDFAREPKLYLEVRAWAISLFRLVHVLHSSWLRVTEDGTRK